MKKIETLTQNFLDFNFNIAEKILPKKFVQIFRNFLSVQVFLYIVFGLLTTVVNIGVFSLLFYAFHLDENLSNVIAIIAAILVAYFTNRGLVFNSTASTFSEKCKEFVKFMIGRSFTLVLEFGCCYLAFRFLSFIPQIVSKSIITILVIIVNFFISKFFAFKSNK